MSDATLKLTLLEKGGKPLIAGVRSDCWRCAGSKKLSTGRADATDPLGVEWEDCYKCQGRGWLPIDDMQAWAKALWPLVYSATISLYEKGEQYHILAKSRQSVYEMHWASGDWNAALEAAAEALGVTS